MYDGEEPKRERERERETQVAEWSKLGACGLGGQCGLGGSIHSVYHSLPFPFLLPDLHPGS